MKLIQVFGSGCANCTRTVALIEQVAAEAAIPVQVSKVTDMGAIVAAGVLRTPGVAIDGRLVHSGSVPDLATIRQWFT